MLRALYRLFVIWIGSYIQLIQHIVELIVKFIIIEYIFHFNELIILMIVWTYKFI